MKIRAILTLLLMGFLPCLSAWAIEPPKARSLSLQECLELVMTNNIELKASQLRRQGAELRRQSAQNSYLPTISLGIGQSADFGRSPDKTGVLVDRSSASTSLSLSLNMTLFSGLRRIYEGKIANKAISRSDAEIEQMIFELRLKTLQYYYTWLLAVEVEENMVKRQDLLQIQWQYASRMVEQGRWAKAKEVEARAAYASAHQARLEARSQTSLAKLDLLQHIELQEGDSLWITLEPMDVENALERAEASSIGVDTRSLVQRLAQGLPSMRALELGLDAAAYSISMARSGYLPRLNLNAGYGNSYYYQWGEEYRAFNQPFAEQWRQNGRSYIGLNLGINIFDAFATRTAIRSAKLEYRLLEVERQRAFKQIERQTTQLKEEVENNRAQIVAARQAYEASEEALRLKQSNYELGRGSHYELEEAINRYQSSLNELSRARINCLLRLETLREYEQASIGW